MFTLNANSQQCWQRLFSVTPPTIARIFYILFLFTVRVNSICHYCTVTKMLFVAIYTRCKQYLPLLTLSLSEIYLCMSVNSIASKSTVYNSLDVLLTVSTTNSMWTYCKYEW